MVEIINKTDACLACGIVELTVVIHVIAASKQQASLDRNRSNSVIIKLSYDLRHYFFLQTAEILSYFTDKFNLSLTKQYRTFI